MNEREPASSFSDTSSETSDETERMNSKPPLMPFVEMLNVCKFVKSDHSEGRVPVNELLSRDNVCRFVKSDHSEGRVPVNELL